MVDTQRPTTEEAPEHIVFRSPGRKPEKKSRAFKATAIGAGLLSIAAFIYLFSGDDSEAISEGTSVTSTTLDNRNTGTTLETTPTTINPDEGPLESAPLNQIYNEYAEQIADGDYVELTRDFFNTELQGSYELAFQLWLANMGEAMNRTDFDFVDTAFAGSEDAASKRDFVRLMVSIGNSRSPWEADLKEYRAAELTGSFTPLREYGANGGAAGELWINVGPSTLPGFRNVLEVNYPNGVYTTGAPNGIFSFQDGLLKVGDPNA